MTPLRDYLLEVYGGFADKRHNDPALDRPIKVDDRGPRDVYPGFCSISVSVPDRHAQDLVLKLYKVPTCPAAVVMVEGLGGTVQTTRFGTSITLSLKSSQGPAISRLAGAISGVVARGRQYGDANLKWICPRTAASLEQLAGHLAEYREELWPDDGRSSGPILDPRDVRPACQPWAPSPPPQRRPNPPARRAGPATTSQ